MTRLSRAVNGSRVGIWARLLTNLSGTLHVIVSTKDRIRSSENGRTRIENGRNSSLGDRDSLLLHGLVDSDSIFIPHLVKLIDTDDTSISEHHGSSFKMEFSLGLRKKKLNTVPGSRMTDAVKPAALDPFPEV